MPDTPRHHHWRNLAELLGAELPPGSEPITPAKPVAEPSEEPAESVTVPSSLAEAEEASFPAEPPAPAAAPESAAPAAPQAPVTVSASLTASPAPATPSKSPPRKSHWGLLARQLGLTPPEEPEQDVQEAAAASEVVTPAAKPAAAREEPGKPGAAAADSVRQTPASPGKPSEPRVASAWGRPSAQEEEPDEFSIVPSTEVLARDSSLVSDWHEHAGDITTDAPEELDLEERPVPTRRRRSALDEVSHESSVEEEQGTGEEDEGDEPRRRRRRRRRRRSGRSEPTALGASELDEPADVDFLEDDTEDIVLDEFAVEEEEVEVEGELEEAPRAETRRRRGSRRRSRRGAGERDRDRTGPERESGSVYPAEFGSDRLTDRDVELEDEDEVEGDDLDEESRPKHTKIPTWDQAIGVLIDANLASRARSPHSQGRGRGRGRGPRR